jgi:hypothetical protein
MLLDVCNSCSKTYGTLLVQPADGPILMWDAYSEGSENASEFNVASVEMDNPRSGARGCTGRTVWPIDVILHPYLLKFGNTNQISEPTYHPSLSSGARAQWFYICIRRSRWELWVLHTDRINSSDEVSSIIASEMPEM